MSRAAIGTNLAGNPVRARSALVTELRAKIRPLRSIRVVVADDHALVREALVELIKLEPDFEVVGQADNGPDALKLVEEAHPDVVLLDLIMPHMSGVEVLARIRERQPNARVLIMTGYFDQDVIFRAFQAGARGYFLKSIPRTELVKAIRAVHAGRTWGEMHVMDQFIHKLPGLAEDRPIKKSPPGLLSQREKEVARLVAEGLNNRQIAERLAVSEQTVKSHLVSIFRKLQVRRRLELAVRTLQHDSFLNHHPEQPAFSS